MVHNKRPMLSNERIQIVAAATRVMLAVLVISCLVSLMIAFMGGAQTNFVLLNTFQKFGIVFAITTGLSSLLYFFRSGSMWTGIWQRTPGWLVFVLLLLNSLVLIGELSYALLSPTEVPLADWRNHASLVCLLLCSVAFALVTAVAHAIAGHPPYSKARW